MVLNVFYFHFLCDEPMNSRKKLEIKEWKSVLVVSVEKVCFVGFVKRVSEKIESKVVVDNEGCKALYVY